MNIQIIYSMLSRVLAASGAALLLPLLLSLYERGPILPFLVPMLLSAALSLFLKRKGAAIVTASILSGLVGSFVFKISEDRKQENRT